MTGRLLRILAGMICAGVLSGCGEETAILVIADLKDFQVPQEIDLLYLEASDDSGVLIGRSFPLVASEPEFSIKLLPGSRMPEQFSVLLYAFLGDVCVAESVSQKVSFASDTTRKTTMVLTRL